MNNLAACFLRHADLQLAAPVRSGRGVEAAKQFEGNLIASLLQSLEESFVRFGENDDSPGADNYSYLGSQALSASLAAHGGFGIATMIAPHLGNESKR